MAKMTGKDKLIAGLKAVGFVRDANARTSKYMVFRKEGVEHHYLIGRSGALRRSKSTVAASISLTDSPFRTALQKVGERAESYTSVEQAVEDLLHIHDELKKKK